MTYPESTEIEFVFAILNDGRIFKYETVGQAIQSNAIAVCIREQAIVNGKSVYDYRFYNKKSKELDKTLEIGNWKAKIQLINDRDKASKIMFRIIAADGQFEQQYLNPGSGAGSISQCVLFLLELNKFNNWQQYKESMELMKSENKLLEFEAELLAIKKEIENIKQEISNCVKVT